MKKLVAPLILVAATAAMAFAAPAHAPAGAMAAPKQVTLRGEIVDTGCYLGSGKHGEGHKECATKCVSEGMPIGLLTTSGKVYLLTPDHDNGDPYNQAKSLAGSMVQVSGALMEKGGISAIDVSSVQGRIWGCVPCTWYASLKASTTAFQLAGNTVLW